MERKLSPHHGLTNAEVQARRAQYGRNRVESAKDETLLEEIIESLREPLVLMLLGVGVLYVLFGSYRDAAIVFAVILTVAITEASIEYRAGKAIKALSDLAAPTVYAWRDGKLQELPADALVPGDVIELRAGSRVPADVRLITSEDLAADESLITGESAPVEHGTAAGVTAEVAAGVLIVRGSARAEVVRIGGSSTLGRIVALVSQAKPPKTPLQRRMGELARSLLIAAVFVSIVIPVIGFYAGRPWREMLLTGLSLAFATIPEELPVLIVVILGLGSLRLARDGAIVRRLRAAETLGSVTVICTDKTGTLTENRMAVTSALSGLNLRHGAESALDPVVLERAALASESGSDEAAFTDPMDAAITSATPLRPTPAHHFPFDASTRLASGFAIQDATVVAAVKGAPEAVLARCTSWRFESAISPLDESVRAELLRAAADRGSGGRVIAVASRNLSHNPARREELECNLVFEGIVVLMDPIRAEVPNAIRTLRRAGVAVCMVTGDQPSTARSVANAVDLERSDVVLGEQAANLMGNELLRRIRSGLVVARATPGDKLELVRHLGEQREVVMVTGDGANDGPALKAAAVGVAMGRIGSDVARESADVVLTNDSFATLARAVRDGRGLYDNFRKAIRFYLAVKVALVLVTAGAAIVRLPLPFSPVQIIILELFMDLGAALAFISLPADRDAMTRPPRPADAPFFDRSMLGWIASGAILLAIVVFAAFMFGLQHGTEPTARAYAIVAWMIGHVALGVAMSGSLAMRQNVPLMLWMAGSTVFALLVAFAPIVSQSIAAAVVPLAPTLAIAALAAAIPLIVLLARASFWRGRRAA